LVAAPFLWIAVELARARITSFPWNLLGYSQIDNAVLTTLAPATGVYGLSFVLAAVNAAIAAAVILPRRRVTTAVALVGAVLATGIQNFGWLMRSPAQTGSQKAVLFQPNLTVGAGESIDVGSLARNSAGLSLQASVLDDEPVRVVLWPESPSPFSTDKPAFMATATSLAGAVHAPLISGALGLVDDPKEQRGYRIYNSAVLFLPGSGYASRYDKIHLVPFGEYVPYANLFKFASGLTQAVGLFDRGTSRATVNADGHRYGVFLCYESIFGDEVRQFVRGGGEVLANLSDDGWYGDTSAPFQHLNMARMRAIENHRWLLRDTNNGVTASIDPAGRVVETMERNRRGAVAVHFDYRSDKTFYTLHGDLFAYFCTLLAVALLAYAAIMKRREVN
jgi:apolipoprotein N-acyltransferase